VNKDLGDVFGNLVNRCLTFAATRFDSRVPEPIEPGPLERQLAIDLDAHLANLRAHHEALAFRKAAEEVRAIWKLGNAYLSEAAPWTAIKTDEVRAATIVHTGLNLVRIAALVAWPFIPFSAGEVLGCLGEPVAWPTSAGALAAGRRFRVPPVLFPKISAACLQPA